MNMCIHRLNRTQSLQGRAQRGFLVLTFALRAQNVKQEGFSFSSSFRSVCYIEPN